MKLTASLGSRLSVAADIVADDTPDAAAACRKPERHDAKSARAGVAASKSAAIKIEA